MSTPSGQQLQVKELRRIENLRGQQKNIKASKKEMAQYNNMKEEILQYMQLKKNKVKTHINHNLKNNFRNMSRHVANDAFSSFNYSQQNTYLVD
ncbi:MAG: mRNA-degrading endonuclease YafQ of YafQ-DinJ toxin-antitoxin module [Pseudohongiellaceae bacterium]|jgi:hypothetical protein